MTTDDIPEGMRLCRAAGWNQLEDDWRIFLDSPGSGGFLDEDQDGVTGTVAYVRYGSFAWIAMMLVDPRKRREGVGSRLMDAALSALSDTCCVGLDASPMGEPLYRRCGLIPAYDIVRTKGQIDAAKFAAPSGAARRMTRHDLPCVLRLDRDIFGADRGRLLTSFFERAPECAWIAEEHGAVLGYTFGRPGRLYGQLGPVVALDRDTARTLLANCFSQLDGKLFAVDVPRLDREWLAWLESVGFAEERPFLRMFRQGDSHPGLPERQYAIAGPEFA